MQNVYTIPIDSKTMDLAGYYVGNLITVDSLKKPKLGDCVLVNYKNKIILMEYRSPYLIPRSSDKTQKVLDVGLVDIIGVIIN